MEMEIVRRAALDNDAYAAAGMAPRTELFDRMVEENTFASLFVRTPEVADAANLPAHAAALVAAYSQLLGQPDFLSLHQTTSRSIGASHVACDIIYEQVAAQVAPGKEAFEQAEQAAHAMEDAAEQSAALQDMLDALAQQDQQDPAVQDDQALAQALLEDAQQAQTGAQAQYQQALADVQAQAQGGPTKAQRAAMAQAIAAAEKQAAPIGQAETMLRGFSLDGEGTPSSVSQTALEIARLLQRNHHLAAILEQVGRLLPLLKSATDKAVRDRLTPKDMTFTSDIVKADLQTVALLQHRVLRRVVLQQIAAGTLMTAEREDTEVVGRGPILIALDESGSMSGSPIVWAKGLVGAILLSARRASRPVQIISFSDHACAYDVPSYLPPLEFVRLLATFDGGGTNYESWMQLAAKSLHTSKFEKADVFLITDGLADISPATATRWDKLRKEMEVRVWSVYIGSGDTRLLESIADTCISLKNVALDGDAVKAAQQALTV